MTLTPEHVGWTYTRDLIETSDFSRRELRGWVETYLDLKLPQHGLCTDPAHCSPMDYLWDSYNQAFDDAVVWANRGGGKTMIGAAATLIDMLRFPGLQARILGGSLEQSRKMHRYLRDIVERNFSDKLARGRAMTRRTIKLSNGSEVEILAQSERSVRGNRVQKMRCDEVELFEQDVWTSCQLVSESRGAAKGTVEVFSTMHRPHGLMEKLVKRAERAGGRSKIYTWCVLDVMETCGPQFACERCELLDPCGRRLKEKVGKLAGHFRVADAIAARRRVSDATWAAEMLCLRPSREGAVFPQFDRARHVRPLRWDRDRPMFRAIDFGFVNPFVCLWVQGDGDGNIRVLQEYARSRATLSANVDRVRQMDPGPVRMSFCDPAGGQRSAHTGTSQRDELRAAGMPTWSRGSQIQVGLELIRRHLDGDGADAGPTLWIDPSCERLIRALEAYRYPTAAERGRGADPELPLKDGVHDHAIDALRYFFVCHRARQRERVTVVRT